MTETKDGGPAFPTFAIRHTLLASGQFATAAVVDKDGMTLLDYFAGQAIGAVIAAQCAGHFSDKRSSEGAAQLAYSIADAMLAERSKGKP